MNKGDVVFIDGKERIFMGEDEQGNYLFKTQWEINHPPKEVPPKIGDTFIFDNEEHFVAGFQDGNAVLKTFKELYSESACKRCHFCYKNKGWINRERPKIGEKMPNTILCSLGQFELTHNPVGFPKDCALRNYKYDQKTEIKRYLGKILNNKARNASMLIEPNVFGKVQVIDIENLTVTYKVPNQKD